jgi:HAD superfamily hydrolase (TIGR01549 family)
MIKALLVDLDGVIIQARHQYFSDRLAEEHNIPLEEVLVFFKNEYGQAAKGEVDIRDVLPQYLAKWNWQGDVNSFLTYWFEGEKDVAEQVLVDLKSARQLGLKVYIVSDNEQQRAEYLMRELKLGELVDGTFFSYEVRMKKSNPDYFAHVVSALGLSVEEVLYIDDDPKNIGVAREVGVRGVTYTPEVRISELK